MLYIAGVGLWVNCIYTLRLMPLNPRDSRIILSPNKKCGIYNCVNIMVISNCIAI